MKRKKGTFISALPALSPMQVIDINTGEYVSDSDFQHSINQLVNAVVQETISLYTTHKQKLESILPAYTGVPQPAEFARQNNITASFTKSLPREIKAKSRIDRIAKFKLISETDSHIKNPNPNKNPPKFTRTINLGAVDGQMVSMSLVDGELALVWKCWDSEYHITFAIPEYIQKRDIIKFSLPIVKLNKKTGG